MTTTTIKETRRTTKAKKLMADWHIARVQLHSASVIANSPLPRRKADFHSRLLTQCIVNERNTRSSFYKLTDKLTPTERVHIIKTYEAPRV